MSAKQPEISLSQETVVLLRAIHKALDEKMALQTACFARDPSVHGEQHRGFTLAMLETKDIINSTVRKLYAEGSDS